TIIIVLLFCFLLHRGLKIASETSDLFLSLLAIGCTLMITLQAFMNIGIVIGILPCTGIPLPFISYGGTSLIVTLSMMGILFNISQYCSREGIGLHLEDENSSQDYDYSECLDAEEN
ncbi:FtsW/RodA/SpoVE family cell cycle protein, partial [bacterium]|nr:FtsW/RodA/SpoVE family cell cycle protein [bacterium]